MDITNQLKGKTNIEIKNGETAEFNWFVGGEKSFDGEINFYLQENCSLKVIGKYNLKEDSKINQKIIIHHQKPGSRSEVELKSVLNDQSDLNIIGQIKAYPNANKTDANLIHKTILLSNSSKVKTDPQLIIEHDDVKCNHGATIGNLNENLLFYLQSRGIKRSDAKNMLIESFLNIAN